MAAAACDVLYFHKVSADPPGYLLPFARLAPVQCTGWTTHFTSGVSEVDYYLSSGLVEADGAEEEYTESAIGRRSRHLDLGDGQAEARDSAGRKVELEST